MDIRGKKFLVIGGAGLIGSHTVDALLKEDVGEVVVYDNFVRGRLENLIQSKSDPRFKVYDIGGDILHLIFWNMRCIMSMAFFTSQLFGFFSVTSFQGPLLT